MAAIVVDGAAAVGVVAVGVAMACDQRCNDGDSDDDKDEQDGNDPEPPLPSFTPWVRSPFPFLDGADLGFLCDWRWDWVDWSLGSVWRGILRRKLIRSRRKGRRILWRWKCGGRCSL